MAIHRSSHRLIRVLLALLLLSASLFVSPAPAEAAVASTGAAGTSYYQYLSGGAWQNLMTPPHTIDGAAAYCLEQAKDFPVNNASYTAFAPASLYGPALMRGLQSILHRGYPYHVPAGLTADQARYATANAIRAWMYESAGIGYSFMDLRGYDGWNAATWTRVKPVGTAVSGTMFRWTLNLLQGARDGLMPARTATAAPITLTPNAGYTQLTGSTTVVFNDLNGNYTYTAPAGVTVTGYTGRAGDRLTVSVPCNATWLGKSISLTLNAYDSRVPANIYYYAPGSSSYQRIVTVNPGSFRLAGSSTLAAQSPVGYLTITKQDQFTAVGLPGAVFNLNWGSVRVARGTTDAAGTLRFGPVAAGTYTLVEATPPAGYLADTTPRTVAIPSTQATGGFPLYLTVPNNPLIRDVSIRKYTTEMVPSPRPGAPDVPRRVYLAGAVFDLFVANPGYSFVASATTDSGGRLAFPDLPYGSYRLVETQAPDGFVLDATPFDFVISSTSPAVLSFFRYNAAADEPRRPVEIMKRDALTRAALAGAVFEISEAGGPLVAELSTDDDGFATSAPLPFGDYTLVETIAPDGYELDPTPIAFSIDASSPATLSFARDNTRIVGYVELIKRSTGSDKRLLPGAHYSIYRVPDTGGAPAAFDPDTAPFAPVATLVTGDQGTARSGALEYGTYYVVETAAPDGHALDATRYYFEIRAPRFVVQLSLGDDPLPLGHGGVVLFYRHVWDGTEIAPSWGYNAPIGEAYMPRVEAEGLAELPIKGFSYVRADYPPEKRLIDGKLVITYWYKRTITGDWRRVRTGDDGSKILTAKDRTRYGLLSTGELYDRLQEARRANPDVIGYISIPGTDLHEPVVQTTDNTTYLSHGADGRVDSRGAIFADYRSPAYVGDASRQTVLHGHNMRDGSMFGVLDRYGDPAFWREHPYVQYVDAAGNGGTWLVYSARPSSGDDAVFSFPAPRPYASLVARFAQASLLDPGFVPSPDGRTLTLSTCAYHVADGKLLIHAELVEER